MWLIHILADQEKECSGHNQKEIWPLMDSSSGPLLLAKPQSRRFHSFPKQHKHLGTKYSNTQACGKHLTFKSQQHYLFCVCFFLISLKPFVGGFCLGVCLQNTHQLDYALSHLQRQELYTMELGLEIVGFLVQICCEDT